MEVAGFELEPLRSNEKARVYIEANILIHIISRFSNKLFYVPLVTLAFLFLPFHHNLVSVQILSVKAIDAFKLDLSAVAGNRLLVQLLLLLLLLGDKERTLRASRANEAWEHASVGPAHVVVAPL